MKGFQLTDVVLGHCPCLSSIQEHRHHKGLVGPHLGGSAERQALEDLPSPNLEYFARLLQSHRYLLLCLVGLADLTTQIGKGLHLLLSSIVDGIDHV